MDRPGIGLLATEARSIVQKAASEHKTPIVIERAEVRPDGLRLLIHDSYGPLPALEVRARENRNAALERLGRDCLETCIIVRARQHIAHRVPGSRFLPPTHFG